MRAREAQLITGAVRRAASPGPCRYQAGGIERPPDRATRLRACALRDHALREAPALSGSSSVRRSNALVGLVFWRAEVRHDRARGVWRRIASDGSRSRVLEHRMFARSVVKMLAEPHALKFSHTVFAGKRHGAFDSVLDRVESARATLRRSRAGPAGIRRDRGVLRCLERTGSARERAPVVPAALMTASAPGRSRDRRRRSFEGGRRRCPRRGASSALSEVFAWANSPSPARGSIKRRAVVGLPRTIGDFLPSKTSSRIASPDPQIHLRHRQRQRLHLRRLSAGSARAPTGRHARAKQGTRSSRRRVRATSS